LVAHTVVVKSERLAADPSLAGQLFEAFKRAKEQAPADEALARTRELIGSDPVPYGIAPNRATLDTVIRFNVDQKIIPQAGAVEDMFAPGTADLTG
jgi:4,5-dihydroxyphthalate decarboxylase